MERVTCAPGRFAVFFFQAEDGIRDLYVIGVQTCALPIYHEPKQSPPAPVPLARPVGQLGGEPLRRGRGEPVDVREDGLGEPGDRLLAELGATDVLEIGRASCRERG